MTFFYNSHTGGYANESPPSPQFITYETQAHLGQGWHIYGTMQEMLQAVQANHWPQPDIKKGALSSTSTLPASASTAAGKIANIGGIQAIGDFFNRLTQANTWIRVGEVAAGLLLLYLGLNAVMKGTSAGNAIQSGTQSVKNTGRKALEATAVVPK